MPIAQKTRRAKGAPVTLADQRAQLVERRRIAQAEYDAARARLIDEPTRASDAASAREQLGALDEAIAAIDARITAEESERAQQRARETHEETIAHLVDLTRVANAVYAEYAHTRAALSAAVERTVPLLVQMRRRLEATRREFLDVSRTVMPTASLGGAPRDDPNSLLTELVRRGASMTAIAKPWIPLPVTDDPLVVQRHERDHASYFDGGDLRLVLPDAGAFASVVDGLVDDERRKHRRES